GTRSQSEDGPVGGEVVAYLETDRKAVIERPERGVERESAGRIAESGDGKERFDSRQGLATAFLVLVQDDVTGAGSMAGERIGRIDLPLEVAVTRKQAGGIHH